MSEGESAAAYNASLNDGGEKKKIMFESFDEPKKVNGEEEPERRLDEVPQFTHEEAQSGVVKLENNPENKGRASFNTFAREAFDQLVADGKVDNPGDVHYRPDYIKDKQEGVFWNLADAAARRGEYAHLARTDRKLWKQKMDEYNAMSPDEKAEVLKKYAPEAIATYVDKRNASYGEKSHKLEKVNGNKDKETETKLLEAYPQLRFLKTRSEVGAFKLEEESEGGNIKVYLQSKDGYNFNYVLRKPKETDPEHIRHRSNKISFLVVEACNVVNPTTGQGIDIVAEKLSPKEALWVLPPETDIAETPKELQEDNYSLDNDTDETYERNIFHQQRSIAMSLTDEQGKPIELTLETPLAVGLIDLATVCHEFGHLNDSKIQQREVVAKEGFADNFKLKLLREIHEKIGRADFLNKHLRKLHRFTTAAYYFKHIGTEEPKDGQYMVSAMTMKKTDTPFVDLETARRWKKNIDVLNNRSK